MKAHDLIYFDNNATTKVDPAVVEEMMPFLTELYGNPSSGYRFGQQVGKAVRDGVELRVGQAAVPVGDCCAGRKAIRGCRHEIVQHAVDHRPMLLAARLYWISDVPE